MFLKQATAVNLMIGPFLNDTDGKTPEEDLTIAQVNVRLSKAGAAFAQKNEDSEATYDENGFYIVALDATDTSTCGPLKLAIQIGDALPFWNDFIVLPANVYDSMIGGTDSLEVEAADKVVEGAITDMDVLKVLLAVMAGLSTGGDTDTIVFRDQADSLDRVEMTVDEDGNRSAVTLNLG